MIRWRVTYMPVVDDRNATDVPSPNLVLVLDSDDPIMALEVERAADFHGVGLVREDTPGWGNSANDLAQG